MMIKYGGLLEAGRVHWSCVDVNTSLSLLHEAQLQKTRGKDGGVQI